MDTNTTKKQPVDVQAETNIDQSGDDPLQDYVAPIAPTVPVETMPIKDNLKSPTNFHIYFDDETSSIHSYVSESCDVPIS